MVESDNNKKVWMAVGAVGTLVAAALAYNYFAGEGDEEAADTPSMNELHDALKEKGLDPVRRADGMIEPNYFLQLLQFIGETNKENLSDSKAKMTKERRAHLKAGDEDAYTAVIKKAFE